jgi:hypothetical protein
MACMNNSNAFFTIWRLPTKNHSAPDNLKIIRRRPTTPVIGSAPHVSLPFSSATTRVVASAHLDRQLTATIDKGAIVGAKAWLDIVTSKFFDE